MSLNKETKSDFSCVTKAKKGMLANLPIAEEKTDSCFFQEHQYVSVCVCVCVCVYIYTVGK